MLEHALKLAQQRWAIFPLKPREKLPISSDMTYKHATHDLAQVAQWWAAHPTANIAIAPAASGTIVLDVDPKNGGLDSLDMLEQAHGRLTTRHVVTGSGGYHFYFKHPGGDIRNKIGALPGMDIIAATGHLVAPPSIHPNGNRYEWADEQAAMEDAPQWLVDLMGPPPQVEPTYKIPTAELPPGALGKLARSTRDLFANGTEEGGRNHALYKAAKDCQQNNMSKEEFTQRALNIPWSLSREETLNTINSAWKTPPKYEPRGLQDEAVKRRIMRCHLIQDLSDASHALFVDLSNGKVHNIDQVVAKRALGNDAWGKYLEDKAVDAEFTYDPSVCAPITLADDGVPVYSTYQPPRWKARSYYQQAPLAPVEAMPALYRDFLLHLTGGDDASYEYLLDWMATSLQDRNFTILTAIGVPGAGKGLLGTIMEKMHGPTNYAKVRDTIFKNHFNAPLKDKTLVYVDECKIVQQEHLDRLKDIVNDMIEVEQKGKDAINVRNWASFYLASNNYDAVKIEAGDRRFSIIQLTNTPLKATQFRDRINDLKDDDNVELLARYLYYRKVDRDMLTPFVSQRTEEVKDAGLADWERYILEDWAMANRGKRVKISKVREDIEREFPRLRQSPSIKKFEDLAKRYPDVLRVVRPDSTKAERFLEALGDKPMEQVDMKKYMI